MQNLGLEEFKVWNAETEIHSLRVLIFKNLSSHPCLSPAVGIKDLIYEKCLMIWPDSDNYNDAYVT